MTKEELYAHSGWKWCTFEGARQKALIEGRRSTLLEKLWWLEEAETLSLRFKEQREKIRETRLISRKGGGI